MLGGSIVLLVALNPIAANAQLSLNIKMANAVPLEIHLSIRESQNRLYAVTSFTNSADRPIYILKHFPGIFVTRNGSDVPYIGVAEKRRPYTLKDYEKVMPAQKVVRTMDITNSFRFAAGTHHYEAIIGGGYFDPLTETLIEGPEVITPFEYNR